MAKITPGPIAGQISGRLGSAVFSHNRGGPYVRNGTIPTTVTSPAALAVKARLAAASQGWKALSDAQRITWTLYAQQNTVLDRLGHQITLSGASMFNRFFCRMVAAGDAPLDVSPVGDPPMPVKTLSCTAEAATPDVQLIFTDTPAGPDARPIVWGCVLESDGISYVKNRLRYLFAGAAALASPIDMTATIVARFGAPQEAQTIHFQMLLQDFATGLVSEPMSCSCLVAAA